jgi:hypothetical protein
MVGVGGLWGSTLSVLVSLASAFVDTSVENDDSEVDNSTNNGTTKYGLTGLGLS